VTRLAIACLALVLCLAGVASTAKATPADERRIVELMTRWADARAAGDVKAAETSAAEAQGLIARLRPDLAGPPPAAQGTVLGYVLELASTHQPTSVARLKAAFARLQEQATRSILFAVSRALEEYRLNRGDFPPPGAKALATALANPANPYLDLPRGMIDREGRIVDGWGVPLHYARAADGGVVLYSWGPDGRDDNGRGDDIRPGK
jgi:hypothetical protein